MFQVFPYRRRASAAAFSICGVLLTGCGNPGSPQPPSLKLPKLVTDLQAARTGDTVTLHWTVPERATDNVALRGDQRAVVCRALAAQPCAAMGELPVQAGASAEFTDTLPAPLQAGPLQLLRYEVRLENHARESAGSSNFAYSAAGDAPPPLLAVTAAATRTGVLVRWQTPAASRVDAPGTRLLVRLQRDRVLAPGESAVPVHGEITAGVPQPPKQTLEALEHPPAATTGLWSPDHTLDAEAAPNRNYRYTAQLVEQVTLEGHALEIDGASAQTDIVSAKDVFPPAVPHDLAVVANGENGAIDLSWSAGEDKDVAGYFVYRRTESSSEAPVRVSGNIPMPVPAWSDTKPVPGTRYSYSVSAVDTSGNESARSTEVSETLPVAGVSAPQKSH